MLVQMVQANETYCVMGRASGKSTGIGPEWFFRRVLLMPGGASFILGSSYKQIKSRTIPPFLSMLETMGLRENVDYVMGKKPPEYWEAKPIVKPRQWDDVLAWSNGHITYLISQDRAGSPNSLSLQFGMIDEARYVDMVRFTTDLSPALRGNHALFGHLPEYLSLLFMTDQPTTAEGRWILDKEKEMKPALIDAIVNLHHQIVLAKKQLTVVTKPTPQADLTRSIANLEKMYDGLRSKAILFVEGNAFDNIHILSADYIRKQFAQLTEPQFRVQIMNERQGKTESSFYPYLDDIEHCYRETFNYEYLDALESDSPDWRQDADLNTSLPLILGPDHGASYNGFQIGQSRGPAWLKVVNSMFVLHPKTAEDLAEDVCKYYAGFPSNEIWYIYDHTMKANSGKARNITFPKEVEAVFLKHGWKFKAIYIGHTPDPTDRYILAANCFRGNDGFTHVSFNRVNTEILRMSMHDVKAKQGTEKDSIVKDKSPERKTTLSQEKAPHGSDGFDLLLHFVAKHWHKQNDNRALSPTAA